MPSFNVNDSNSNGFHDGKILEKCQESEKLFSIMKYKYECRIKALKDSEEKLKELAEYALDYAHSIGNWY